ncbi:hypothetical protein ACWDUX_30100 [Streptomyces sp. NPDC003444]
MTAYPDPFEETSPWDTPENPPTKETPPMPDTPTNSPAPFRIGVTLKAGSAYDAEWLTPTVYGHTPEETAQRAAALLTSLKAEGLIDLTAKAADYTRGQYKGGAKAPAGAAPKRFNNGKVEQRQDQAPKTVGDDCPHGRSLVSKANWSALFCNSDTDKCEPLWKQKDGSYKANG